MVCYINVNDYPGPGDDHCTTLIPPIRYQDACLPELKYSAERLEALNHNRPPHRSIRKAIFQHYLWLPARYRNVLHRQNSSIMQKTCRLLIFVVLMVSLIFLFSSVSELLANVGLHLVQFIHCECTPQIVYTMY